MPTYSSRLSSPLGPTEGLQEGQGIQGKGGRGWPGQGMRLTFFRDVTSCLRRRAGEMSLRMLPWVQVQGGDLGRGCLGWSQTGLGEQLGPEGCSGWGSVLAGSRLLWES